MADLTANTALRDAMVRHQLQLQRFASGLVAKVRGLLNATEEELAKIIRDRLAKATSLNSPADVKRLNTLLQMVMNLRQTTIDQANDVWNDQLTQLAKLEPTFMAQQLNTTSPAVLDLTLPAAAQLKAIVRSEPFEGATLKQWADKIAVDDIRRISNQVRLGMMAGEDSATIARRVVGSARLLGLDGVTEITRRNADAITRTAVNFTSNRARREFLLKNKELFSEEMFLATLDSRTTPICRSLDGELYEVGDGPIPPLHWNCRSTRVAVLDGKVVGNRPARAFTEEQLLREFNKANGLDAASRADLPRGMKGKYDAFARKRMRELTGTVPASTTYQEWLTSQSKEFQDDVLGKTKGELFRKGGLTLDKFVSRTGDELTLAELAQKQASAFRAAGLDPEEYL